MRGSLKTLGAVCLLFVLASCGGGQAQSNPFVGVGPEQIAVNVDNRNFNDATVYAVVPGSRRRLGVVTGKTTASFRLDWDRDQTIRLRVDLLAAQTYTTQGLRVRPGEQVQLIIDPILARTLIRN